MCSCVNRVSKSDCWFTPAFCMKWLLELAAGVIQCLCSRKQLVNNDGEKGVTCNSCSVVPVDQCSPEPRDPLLTLARMPSCVRNGEQALKTYRDAAEDKQNLLMLCRGYSELCLYTRLLAKWVGQALLGWDAAQLKQMGVKQPLGISQNTLIGVQLQFLGSSVSLICFRAHTNKEAVKCFVIFF